MKKNFITAIILFATASSLMAQQIPLNSSTYFMRLLNNPALTAYNGSTNVYAYYRNQWTGMPGHPVTMGGVGEISLWGDRSGVGVAVSNDVTSIISNTSAQIYYAQKIKLAPGHHLAVGLSFGLLDTHVDYENAIANDPNDPTIFSTHKSGVGFDMNIGLAYQWKKLTIGFAVPHVVNTNVTLGDQTRSSNYDALRNYVAHASYEFSFKKEKWHLEPSIMFKKGAGSLYQIEGNLMANYKRMVYLGIGYRQDYGMTAQAAVRISRCVTLGYSYEYPILSGPTYGNTKGTHEVLVGMNFDKWLKNSELKKLKKRMDALEADNKDLKRNDTILSRRIDSLEAKTKQLDEDNKASHKSMTDRIDSLEKQMREYKKETSQKLTNALSDLLAAKDKPAKDGIYKMDKVYFENNSSDLKKESYSQLDQLGQMMKDNPDIKIKVLGHTDNIASDAYNITLSEKRAESVTNYLIGRGIAASRLSAIGFGKRMPVADNTTEEGRALNRRVEIQLINK